MYPPDSLLVHARCEPAPAWPFPSRFCRNAKQAESLAFIMPGCTSQAFPYCPPPARVLDDGPAHRVDPVLLLLHRASMHMSQHCRSIERCTTIHPTDTASPALRTLRSHTLMPHSDHQTHPPPLLPTRWYSLIASAASNTHPGTHPLPLPSFTLPSMPRTPTRHPFSPCPVLISLPACRTFSDSAMKNMLSLLVEISKAKGLLMVSSAPLIDRHLFTCRRKVWNTQGWSKGQ